MMGAEQHERCCISPRGRIVMFAVVREATYDSEKRTGASKQIDEFARIRAQQPGYRGVVTVDAGDGRTLTIALWETEEQSRAASATISPEAERLMGPLWATPSRVIGSGEVIYDDLTMA
jgi:hypothetical protein